MQQPGARAGPAPGHAAEPHGHPVSSPARRPSVLAPGLFRPSAFRRAASPFSQLGRGSRRHPRAFVCMEPLAGVMLGNREARPEAFLWLASGCVPASLR